MVGRDGAVGIAAGSTVRVSNTGWARFSAPNLHYHGHRVISEVKAAGAWR